MRTPDVIVAMSGGVDSAVAALRLVEAGANVHGLFMSNWEEDELGYCTAAEDYRDAHRVCDELAIPLHKVEFAREYRQRVFAHFLAEYSAGRTPNPDVLCNREIKFGVLLDYARRLGATRLATGHYARLERRARYTALLTACDSDKDQSYFLHAVAPTALASVQFPIGALGKPQVREIARRHGFVNHAKRDSTGICFIGERPFAEFLGRYLPAQPGDIRSTDGRWLGRHQGLMYYTLGQRRGLGIGGRRDGNAMPWYVARKDLASNTLIAVQQHDHPLLEARILLAARLNWLCPAPTGALRCHARVRYRQAAQPCTAMPVDGGRWRVAFDRPQRAMTPGQYVVFYDAEECLGGGLIESVKTRSATPAYPLRRAAG